MNIKSNQGDSYDECALVAKCLALVDESRMGKRLYAKCMAQTENPSKPSPTGRISMNRGLKMWGNKGWSAVEAELSQIHNRDVLDPQDHSKLTHEEKRNALESHLFLEEKKNKEIKGKMVGGGNKQRSYTSRQEASSPTSHI